MDKGVSLIDLTIPDECQNAQLDEMPPSEPTLGLINLGREFGI